MLSLVNLTVLSTHLNVRGNERVNLLCEHGSNGDVWFVEYQGKPKIQRNKILKFSLPSKVDPFFFYSNKRFFIYDHEVGNFFSSLLSMIVVISEITHGRNFSSTSCHVLDVDF